MKAKTIAEINADRHKECILTASVEVEKIRGKRTFLCNCECGNETKANANDLKRGNTKSCGCKKQLVGEKTALTLDQINISKPIESILTAISFSDSERSKSGRAIRMINCVCECGVKKILKVDSVVSGSSLSCGCLFYKMLKEVHTKYFPSIPELHSKYKGMLSRCYNPNDPSYKYYGGRGVTICDEWKGDYQSFLDWSLANGWDSGLHIDKDKLVKGNLVYSPSTCCYLTPAENNQYRRPKSKHSK